MTPRPERAVVKGTMLNLVQFRNMFTATVSPAELDTPQSLWDTYLHDVYDPILAYLSPTLTTQTVELQHWVGDGWETYDEPAFTIAGTDTGTASPNAVAVVLIGKAIGRRLLGRKFFGGVSEQATDGNTLNPAPLAAFVTSLAAYITLQFGPHGGAIEPGIFTKAHVIVPFTSGLVSSIVGSMRRRKPGIGT